jgi:hypothetical protein
MDAYQGYIYNRSCRCPRCLSRGLMGPAILIALGLVFLGHRGEFIVPAVLIVIGVVKLLQHTASTDGHINPYVLVTPVQPGVPPQPAPTMPAEPAKEEHHG